MYVFSMYTMVNTKSGFEKGTCSAGQTGDLDLVTGI